MEDTARRVNTEKEKERKGKRKKEKDKDVESPMWLPKEQIYAWRKEKWKGKRCWISEWGERERDEREREGGEREEAIKSGHGNFIFPFF